MHLPAYLRLIFYISIWAIILCLSLWISGKTYTQLTGELQGYTQLPVSTFFSEKAFYLTSRFCFFMAFGSLAGIILTISFRKNLENAYQKLKYDGYLFFSAAWRHLTLYWHELSLGEKAILTGIFLAGIIFRYYLAWQPLRGDESTIFYSLAQKPFWIITGIYTNAGNHIFHTLLMHISWSLFGNSLLAIRLPVLLAGSLLIPLTYYVARIYRNKPEALLLTAFIASGSALIEYSCNSRGYMVQILLLVLLFGVGLFIRRHQNSFAFLLWVIFSAFVFWTHPTSLYIYGGLGLWLLHEIYILNPGTLRFSHLKSFILWTVSAGILTFLLYMPVLLVNQSFGQPGSLLKDSTQHGLEGFISLVRFMPDLWQIWSRNWQFPLDYIALGCLVTGLGACFKDRLFRQVEIWVLLWGSLAGAIAFTTYARMWLVFSWFIYMLVSRGMYFLVTLSKAPKNYLLPVMALCWATFAFNDEYQNQHIYTIPDDAFQDAPLAAASLKLLMIDNDLVFAPCPATFPLKYALEQLGLHVKMVDKNSGNGTNAFLTLNTIKGNKVSKRRIWVIILNYGPTNYDTVWKLLQLPPLTKPMANFSTGAIYLVEETIL